MTSLVLGLLLEQDGEALYKKMAEQIGGPDTLRVSMKLKSELGGKVLKESTGLLETQDPNFLRIKLDGTNQGKPESVSMKCDGERMQIGEKIKPAPQKAAQNYRIILLQFGMSIYLNSKAIRGVALEASDFKPVRTEKLGTVETKVLEYSLVSDKIDFELRTTVWLDAKTTLPVKRVSVIATKSGEKLTFTDTYASFEPDVKLDPKIFEVPK